MSILGKLLLVNVTSMFFLSLLSLSLLYSISRVIWMNERADVNIFTSDDYKSFSIPHDSVSSNQRELVSHFGNVEYQCHGSCSCSSEGLEEQTYQRRYVTSNSGLRMGIMFLVTSISSLLVFQKAERQLHDECIDVFSSSCSSDFIISEINDCEPITSISSTRNPRRKKEEIQNQQHELPFGDENAYEDDKDSQDDNMNTEEKAEEEEEEEEVSNIFRYFCRGNCIPRVGYKQKAARIEAAKIDCEALKIERELDFDCKKLGPGICNQKVIVKFNTFLTPFCKKHSRIKYLYQSPTYWRVRHWRHMNVCVSKSYGRNYTIKCKRIKVEEQKN